MTKRTSSPSAKGTPKTVAKPGSNGTPPTDPNSVIISVPSPDTSEEYTGWTLQFGNGNVQHVRVKGGRGRISFSNNGRGRGGGGEVRIYRNESTKTFDAVFTDVTHVVSDRVTNHRTTDEVVPEPKSSMTMASPSLNPSAF